MPVVRLSATFIQRVCCQEGQTKATYFDAETRGFLLEVRSSGRKTFYTKYTDERGRERQFKIGPAEVLTLKQAKQKAKEIKARALLGASPQDERQKRRSIPTLKQFVNTQYLPFVKSYKRSWRTDETVLRRHILPRLGGLCLDEIRPAAIVAILAVLRDNGYAPGTIGRIIILLRYIFNLARKWGTVKDLDNPAASIPVPPDVQRTRYLDRNEIGRLIAALAQDEPSRCERDIASVTHRRAP